MSTRQQPSPPSRLLSLPTELRLRILSFAVTSTTDFTKPRISIPRDGYYLRLPPITQASQQLRQESLPLYYEENLFLFNLDDVLETPTLQQDLLYEKRLLGFSAWCQAVGGEMFGHMRRVVLSVNCYSGVILAEDVHLLVEVGRGGVQVSVHPYVWCIPEIVWPERGEEVSGEGGKVCVQKGMLPERVGGFLKERLRGNEGRGLLQEDLVEFCGVVREEMEGVKEARHAVDWRIVKMVCPSMITS